MKLGLLTIFLCFLSCSSDKGTQTIFYIIKHHDIIANSPTADAETGSSDVPPPPTPLPPLFYGDHNFILTADNHIYYHDNYKYYDCGVGIDFSKPPRLFITADSISEIKIADLPTFLTSKLPDSSYSRKRLGVSISSTTDTITNPGFEIITKYFSSKDISEYNVRRLTEEEQYALTSKLQNKTYDPIRAEFKIGFDSD